MHAKQVFLLREGAFFPGSGSGRSLASCKEVKVSKACSSASVRWHIVSFGEKYTDGPFAGSEWQAIGETDPDWRLFIAWGMNE